jgi:anti-anti-sigma regulatory factor
MVMRQLEASMAGSYRTIEVERRGDVSFVRFQSISLGEPALDEMGRELFHLIHVEGCRRLVLMVGPVNCLYSAFLAKLMIVRRYLLQHEGRLKLCDVPPFLHEIFRVCKLDGLFEFARDHDDALHNW